jgi:lipoprotein-releasing system permease protein
MYKLFLCLRYLRTRWIALASVVSVTLGVATLIVVNSVMGGFATEMRSRVKGILSDIMIEGLGLNGFGGADLLIRRIREEFGDQIVAVTPVIESPGMLVLTIHGKEFPEFVQIYGVDMDSYGQVCKFLEYLHEKGLREHPTFEISDELRRRVEWWRDAAPEPSDDATGGTLFVPDDSDEPQPAVTLGKPQGSTAADETISQPEHSDKPSERPWPRANPFEQHEQPQADRQRTGPLLEPLPDEPEKERGIIIPYLLATTRWKHRDVDLVKPGDSVRVGLPYTSTTRMNMELRQSAFTTIGRFKSGMSEYDQSHCYVDIRDLQELRGMNGRVNSIYIKLKDYSDAPEVTERLRSMFLPPDFQIRTWEQKQGQILSAVAVEQNILNVLLFMIIAVAGFGILAIFYMIVVEKMRDIGILKSLGASDGGVMSIFLGYGFGLGVVGSGLGMVIGLLIVIYLDNIEDLISRLSGHRVFDPDLYYFDKIPTVISWFSIACIVLGALLIAVAASVLPAWRAARLRPVQSLRY